MWPFQRKSKPVYPEFIQRYQELTFLPDRLQSISDGKYIVIDCESTGIDKQASIITIGAVTLCQHEIKLEEVLDVRLSLMASSKEAEIHGELSDQLEILEIDQMRKVLQYIKNAILVGHHVSFDIQLINRWFQKEFPGFKLLNPSVDTLAMIRRVDPQRMERQVAGHDGFQLDRLCKEYDIAIENRHTALGDAYMTAQLFHKISLTLEKRGVTLVKQIIR